MPQDDLDHIPSIVPTRDTVAPRPSGGRAAKGASRGSGGPRGPRGAGGGSGVGPFARLLITLALVVAGVACAWAWQLQQELEQNRALAEGYAKRIADLEARLSDTDEGMNQNAEMQAAKIRELDSEVRKLWDNVWKQAGERLTKLENDNAVQGKKISATSAAVAAVETQVKGAAGDIAKLKKVADELDRLIASGRANQAEVERVADSINRVNLDLAKLNKRVQSNEEWINSINAFRKQVNASIVELQAAVRSQPKPTGTP
jgi:DNA repair exonuclease SbcCD ATPase subunit